MTREEYNQQYLIVDEIKFTPRYELQEIEIINEDGEVIKDFDYIITNTAEEAYQEWLASKELPPLITEVERLAIAEQAINDLMMIIMMNGGM